MGLIQRHLFKRLVYRRVFEFQKIFSRMTYPLLRLEKSSEEIGDNQDGSIRSLANSIFGSDNPLLMQACLGAQLEIFPDFYTRFFFEGDSQMYNDFHTSIVNGDPILNPYPIQIAADLFRVTFFCVIDADMAAIVEYSPQNLETLMNQPLPENHQGYTSKKAFWLINPITMTCGWQTLLPGGTNAYAPNRRRLFAIKLAKRNNKPADTLVSLCQDMIESEDCGVLVTTDEIKKLDSMIHRLGFTKVKMVGDGNCVPRGLAHQILGHQRYYPLIRKLAVAQLREYPGQYVDHCILKKKKEPIR